MEVNKNEKIEGYANRGGNRENVQHSIWAISQKWRNSTWGIFDYVKVNFECTLQKVTFKEKIPTLKALGSL